MLRLALYAICLFISFSMSASLDEVICGAVVEAAQEVAGLSAPSNSSGMTPWSEGTMVTSGSRSRDDDRGGSELRGLCCLTAILFIMATNNNNARYYR